MSDVQRLLEVMERLRDPVSGCPWDREQSFETIAPYTIEEAYEVAEAIDRDDMGDLVDELGDLLFQVVFHAQMAHERGAFSFPDVVNAIVEKMVRRHPHVFAPESVDSREDLGRIWQRAKSAERAAKGRMPAQSVMDDVARGQPAMGRAEALQRTAAGHGFDWRRPDDVLPKLHEEMEELRGALHSHAGREQIASEVGDLLFTCVNLSRHLDVDPEAALRGANLKFERRFREVESAVRAADAELQDCSLEELDRLWEEVKNRERQPTERQPR